MDAGAHIIRTKKVNQILVSGGTVSERRDFDGKVCVFGWQAHFVVAGHVVEGPDDGFAGIRDFYSLGEDGFMLEFREVHVKNDITGFDDFATFLGFADQFKMTVFLEIEGSSHWAIFTFQELRVSVPAIGEGTGADEFNLAIAQIFGFKLPFYGRLGENGGVEQ
jgi:hypothetical protein